MVFLPPDAEGDFLRTSWRRMRLGTPRRLSSYTPGTSVVGAGGIVTRAGTARYVDANGILRTAAIDVIRDGHFIGGVRTTLLEGARTNACTYSEDFTNAAWTKTGGAVALDATGPDGVVSSAATFTEDSSTGLHGPNHAAAAFTANTIQAISVFVKAGTRTKARFILDGAVTGQFGVNIDLVAGTITNQTSGAGSSITTKEITALGGGWYRVKVTGKCDATSTGGNYYLASLDDAGTLSYAGNGTGTLQWFGMQHEVNPTTTNPAASSYIPTVATSVARAADIGPYWPWTNPPMESTFYQKCIHQGDLVNTYLGLNALVNANPRFLMDGTNTVRRVFTNNGSANVSSTPVIAPAIGDTVEYRALLYADGSVQFGQTINGGTEVMSARSAANALAAAWTGAPTFMFLNSTNSTGNIGFNAYIANKSFAGLATLAQVRAG